MNWKAILVGGLVGFALAYFLGYAVTGLVSPLAAIFAAGLIGGMIAGILSPEDAWKNGLAAGVVLTIGNTILSFLYVAYGFVDLPPHNSIDAFGGFILTLIMYAIIGMIGGFVGGKLKKRK